jgi:hypothetical protein
MCGGDVTGSPVVRQVEYRGHPASNFVGSLPALHRRRTIKHVAIVHGKLHQQPHQPAADLRLGAFFPHGGSGRAAR